MGYKLFHDGEERECNLAPSTAKRIEKLHRLYTESAVIPDNVKEQICEQRGWFDAVDPAEHAQVFTDLLSDDEGEKTDVHREIYALLKRREGDLQTKVYHTSQEVKYQEHHKRLAKIIFIDLPNNPEWEKLLNGNVQRGANDFLSDAGGFSGEEDDMSRLLQVMTAQNGATSGTATSPTGTATPNR